MKLIEMIQQTPVADIIAECVRLDERNGADPYQQVVDVLLKLDPISKPGFEIVLEPWKDDDGTVSIFFNISGVYENDVDRYAIEFNPWEEWLGANIRVSGLDATPTQIIAQCLYEMTFISFDQEEVKEVMDNMVESIKDIKDNLDTLPEFKPDKTDD